MENNLDNILYDVFGDDITDTERQSFIYFLKGCGAYDKYMENLDIVELKKLKEGLYGKNSQITFYNIIPSSFTWQNTKDGYAYWKIISTLHKIIFTIKYQKNIIKPNDGLIWYFGFHGYSLHYNMVTINHLLSIYQIKDKKINLFISKFNEYCKENNL